jgi:DNA invertase Pin-like site-specific DNA recombinase
MVQKLSNLRRRTVKKLVTYIRVSTQKQGASGLGLEGQTAAVEAYARGQGAEIVRTFREVESGKRADRPELVKALALAKRAGATLVVAKLDRLARNVAFLSRLMESGVDFVACDQPNANRLTVHILAAVAEDESKRISERTKAALAAYKARGGTLGTDNLTADGRAKGAKRAGEVVRALAQAEYADLLPTIKGLRAGLASLREIAARLNADGHTTRRGKPWTAVQVLRVLDRAGA